MWFIFCRYASILCIIQSFKLQRKRNTKEPQLLTHLFLLRCNNNHIVKTTPRWTCECGAISSGRFKQSVFENRFFFVLFILYISSLLFFFFYFVSLVCISLSVDVDRTKIICIIFNKHKTQGGSQANKLSQHTRLMVPLHKTK